MAHFARLADGVVAEVLVVKNSVLDPADEETSGREFLARLLRRDPDEFVQASYSGSFRGRFPGVGDVYDADADVFVQPVEGRPVGRLRALLRRL